MHSLKVLCERGLIKQSHVDCVILTGGRDLTLCGPEKEKRVIKSLILCKVMLVIEELHGFDLRKWVIHQTSQIKNWVCMGDNEYTSFLTTISHPNQYFLLLVHYKKHIKNKSSLLL